MATKRPHGEVDLEDEDGDENFLDDSLVRIMCSNGEILLILQFFQDGTIGYLP